MGEENKGKGFKRKLYKMEKRWHGRGTVDIAE
jgi:hypothetical protein